MRARRHQTHRHPGLPLRPNAHASGIGVPKLASSFAVGITIAVNIVHSGGCK